MTNIQTTTINSLDDRINSNNKKVELIKPTFAELWDLCVNRIYDVSALTSDIASLLTQNGHNIDARIIDTSAGTGVPMIPLYKLGYKNIACMDAFDDEIAMFAKNAANAGVPLTCTKAEWLAMNQHYKKGEADVLFCRGNSFIYAAGGWNEDIAVDKEKSLAMYLNTLKQFHDTLAPGGMLYVDKFKDDEVPTKDTVMQVTVDGSVRDLVFYTERRPQTHTRKAQMLLRDEAGREEGLVNVTYLLSKPELTNMMKEAGFKVVKDAEVKSETHFDVVLAYK